jgi:hypothetical protein
MPVAVVDPDASGQLVVMSSLASPTLTSDPWPALTSVVQHEFEAGRLATAFTPDGAEMGTISKAGCWREPRTSIGRRTESVLFKERRTALLA